DLGGLVELGPLAADEQVHRLLERIGLLAVDVVGDRLVFLAPRHAYPSTSMPIERAVPSTIRIAASMSFAFRSGVLFCAISLTWPRVTLPTLVLLGSPEPLASFAARFKSTAAGGVFRMNVKVRSEKIEMTAGMISPC